MTRFTRLWILTVIAGLAALRTFAEAQEHPVPGSLDLGDGVRLELVYLQPGTFLQGSPMTEKDRSPDETQRPVRITQGFSIGKHPVTRRQFERFVLETRYRTEAEKGTSGGFGWNGRELQQERRFQWRDPGFPQTGDHPVTLVTWNDAQEFNRWLSRRTGLTVQLPTEAQWEYAARAGTEHTYPGSGEPDAVAWHRGNAENATHPVGLKLPNAWGLGDMGGSVSEWCRDWYGPYSSDSVDDPEATRSPAGDKPRRVLRGGSWLREARHGRVAARWRSDPGSRNADIGFRIVVSPSTPAKAEPPTPTDTPVSLPENPRQTPPTEPQPTGNDAGIPEAHELPIHSTTLSMSVLDPLDPGLSPWSTQGHRVAQFIPLILLSLVGIVVVRTWVRWFRQNRFEPRKKTWNTAPRIQRSPPPQPSDRPAPIRIVDDGFWLPRDAAAVGATVEYEYVLEGRRCTDHVVFEPNAQGQFIYTGARPTDIRFMAAPPRHEEILPSHTVIAEPDAGVTSPSTPRASTADHIAGVVAGVGGAALGWHAVRGRTQRQDPLPRHRNPAAY